MSCWSHNPIVLYNTDAVQYHNTNELRHRESIGFLSSYFNKNAWFTVQHCNTRRIEMGEWKLHQFVYYQDFYFAHHRGSNWCTIAAAMLIGKFIAVWNRRHCAELQCTRVWCWDYLLPWNRKSTLSAHRDPMHFNNSRVKKLKCTRLYNPFYYATMLLYCKHVNKMEKVEFSSFVPPHFIFSLRALLWNHKRGKYLK